MHQTLLPQGWARPKGYANGILAEPGTQIFVGGQIGWNDQCVFESDDFVPAFFHAVQTGELERALVGFRSAVTEKGFAETSSAKHFGEVALRFHEPGVRHVDQFGGLFLDGLCDLRRTMSQNVAAPAWEQIEVALSFGVPAMLSFTSNKADRVPGVVRNDVFVELGNPVLTGHGGG